MLGAQVVVPSLDGPIKLRIPPGTSHGRQLRVRGHGLPKGRSAERGDMHIVVNIQIPPSLSDEERALWEKLARVSRFNPRPPA